MPIAMFMGVMGLMYIGSLAYTEMSIQRSRDDAAGAAQAMATVHTLAARQCTAPYTCAVGPVTVVAPPGSSINAAGLSERFVSYSDGSVVVTTLTPAYLLRLGSQTRALSTALSVVTEGSVLAGPYNPDVTAVGDGMARRLVRLPDGSSRMETGVLSIRLRSIPQSIGGVTLSAGQPIMATPIY